MLGFGLKIVHYLQAGERRYGFLLHDKVVVDRKKASKTLGIDLPEEIMTFIQEWDKLQPHLPKFRALESQAKEGMPLEKIERFLPPVTHPPKIICLGLNYRSHAAEAKASIPKEPILFFKPRTTIIGPYDDILSPNITKQLDYEVELAAIIGKTCRRVKEGDAQRFLMGYMVLNDVSARDLQFSERQWVRGKGLDTFAPTGPWIVTGDELSMENLRLTTRVNGTLRQNTTTSDMIFPLSYVISWLSQGITLEPGDIISTGTPAGVGVFMNPPSFLGEGDVVEVGVEGIGTLRNVVRFEKPS